MRLLLLGTSGYYPTEKRHTSCFLLPELGVVLDAGTAMFRLRRHLIRQTLDVFLTHAHLDHVAGLTYLFGVLPGSGIPFVRVHGEAAKLQAIREHLFHPTLFPALPPISFAPLSGPVRLPRDAIIRSFPLEHPGGTLGYRIEWAGRSLAYVTDTTAAAEASYVEEISRVDLLVHECYFPDGRDDDAKLTGHSCLTPVLEVAARARVGRLILVHINPLATDDPPLDLQQARRVFPAAEIGFDGMEVDV